MRNYMSCGNCVFSAETTDLASLGSQFEHSLRNLPTRTRSRHNRRVLVAGGTADAKSAHRVRADYRKRFISLGNTRPSMNWNFSNEWTVWVL